MPRVLITGVAGFIGMHTAIRLLNEGWDVVGLDNMNNYYENSLKKDRLRLIKEIENESNVSFVFCEFDLNSKVWDKLKSYQIDVCIHLAAQAGVRYSLDNPRAYLESNVLGFQSVLEFVANQKIKQLIYASSSSVYGKNGRMPFNEIDGCNNPESYYAATKKANEMMAHSYFKTHGINSIGLRFFTVYGPWGRPDMAPYIFTKAAFEGREIDVYNYGNQKRDFTYVSDIVQGIYLCVKSGTTGFEILNIGNGNPTKLLDFIKIIENSTRRKIKKCFIEAQLGDVEETYADIGKIHTELGFSPKVGLQSGINKFVEWYKTYYEIT